MEDFSTHSFTVNRKGLVWLVFITAAWAAVVVVALTVAIIPYFRNTDIQDLSAMIWPGLIVLLFIAAYTGFALYCDWRTYLFAKETSLQINMLDFTFTYSHAGKTIVFKPKDVAHWYWDTGLLISRVSSNHTVIVLKSGETLFVPCWLFDSNKFFLSDYHRYNANYFIHLHHDKLFFPDAEDAPRYRYLLPED